MLIITTPLFIVNLIYKKISKKFDISVIWNFIFSSKQSKITFVTLFKKVVIKNENDYQKNNRK